MMTEDELLREIIHLRRGEGSNYYGLDLEHELGQIYMPRLDPNASDEEIIAWGTEFKRIFTAKILEKEAELTREQS